MVGGWTCSNAGRAGHTGTRSGGGHSVEHLLGVTDDAPSRATPAETALARDVRDVLHGALELALERVGCDRGESRGSRPAEHGGADATASGYE